MSETGSLESNIRGALDLLIPKIREHAATSGQPIILGITGLQGSGKSTWAAGIVNLLSSHYELRAITLSLDDLYKTHDDLIAQREKELERTRQRP